MVLVAWNKVELFVAPKMEARFQKVEDTGLKPSESTREDTMMNEDELCRYLMRVFCETRSADGELRFVQHRVYQEAALWIAAVVHGIYAFGTGIRLSRDGGRQVLFEHEGRLFKARFNHLEGHRGIAIVEVLPTQGRPDGGTVYRIRSNADAFAFADHAEEILRVFENQAA